MSEAPRAEEKGLRKALADFGKKENVKREVLDFFSRLLDNPSDYEGYKKILIYKGDYVRTYEFMIAMLHSQSRMDEAYDAKLGMIRAVSETSGYLPIWGLTPELVEKLGSLRDTVGDIRDWLNRFYAKTVFGHGVETRDYRNMVWRGGYDTVYPARICENPLSLLREIRHEFHREIDQVMPNVDKAIFPLASSHRQPGASGSGYEYGPFGPEGGGGGGDASVQVAISAVARPPEK